jgi:hypothetical protein
MGQFFGIGSGCAQQSCAATTAKTTPMMMIRCRDIAYSTVIVAPWFGAAGDEAVNGG